MAGLNVNMNNVLDSLSDAAFIRIKAKFKINKTLFINAKDHPMADPLLQVILDDRIFPLMSRDLFAKVIMSIIPRDILELRWLGKYADLLVRTLGNVQQNTTKDPRANMYANHLLNTMIPDFKKNIQSSQKSASFTDELGFIFKISSCLLRCTAHNKYPFDLILDTGIMQELEYKVSKLPGNLFGSYRNEERAYALLISWILEEVLCEQDGIEV